MAHSSPHLPHVHRLAPGWRVAVVFMVFSAFAASIAQAERADRNKPTNIEADQLVHDELNQVSRFSGRAVLSRGSMVLRGERIEVRQDPDGYQFGTVLPDDSSAAPPQPAKAQASAPKRAFFRQKREGADEFIEGEATRIEFDGKTDQVRLLGSAEIRRYRGAVLKDQMTGSEIVYDNLNDVFRMDGQPVSASGTSGAASTAGRGRVRAVLAPRGNPQDKP